MITSFGKFCRNLRMDNSELLYEMAQRLNVSSAFLSRVENGKAKPPVEWIEIIAVGYHLNDKQVEELRASIAESRENVIKMDNLSQNDRNMIFAFARQLNELNAEEKDRWKKMLKIEEEDC